MHIFPVLLLIVYLSFPSGATGADSGIANALTFEYKPETMIELAKQGGSVLGTYVRMGGSIELTIPPGSEPVLLFRHPGTDTLTFPVVGNIPLEKGELAIVHAYHYAPEALRVQAIHGEHWSEMRFLFRAKGIGIFHEVNQGMPEGALRITAMFLVKPEKWQYEWVTMKRSEFPPDQPLSIALLWNCNKVALRINSKTMPWATLQSPLNWGETFSLGGTGEQAFDGWIQSVQVSKISSSSP